MTGSHEVRGSIPLGSTNTYKTYISDLHLHLRPTTYISDLHRLQKTTIAYKNLHRVQKPPVADIRGWIVHLSVPIQPQWFAPRERVLRCYRHSFK